MMRSLTLITLLLGALLHLSAAHAQDQYKSLPPRGIAIAPELIQELRAMTGELRRDLAAALAADPRGDSWRADVEVFIRAAELAVDQGLFYKPKDPETVKEALRIARARLQASAGGDAAPPSDAQRALELLAIGSRGEHAGRTLAGGFVSLIDGSVQPYGLVIPADLEQSAEKPLRLDIWLHGRGDTTTEIPFLMDRLSKIGTYAPPDTLVLHPFGRHCNAFKFAGETDVYEALQHVARRFAVDPARISIRGFSMGGAGCWHLAAHDPGRWFAANPGAGFVDTIRYQGWDQKPMPYESGDWGRRLMNWYDVPPWVENLSNTNVIAYSGEMDAQRQAAEIMVEAAQQQGLQFPHVIGVGMGHKIDEASATAIESYLAQWANAADGQYRRWIRLVTYTLRYNNIQWLSVQGLKEHWQRAAVSAELVQPATIRLKTENIDALRLDFTDQGWPLASGQIRLEINDQIFGGPTAASDQPLLIDLVEHDGQWYEMDRSEDPTAAGQALRKRPGLQGPIDDALTGPFLFVLPSRPCRHGAVERFVQHEIQWARDAWQRVMRGDDRVVLDTELTAEQIASHHLICFGDFTGNRYLAGIAASLPIRWQDEEIVAGDRRFDASSHALAMVFPNPRSPARYVVVNSGITFREFSNNTNARQIAMLPDWAVIDVTVPSDGIFPGPIVAANFFDEAWQLKATGPQR